MSVELGSLDEEEIRSRFMQGVYTPPLALSQLPISIPAPQGISSASSIQRAEGRIAPTRERPKLAPPPQNIMVKVLRAHQETERLNERKAEVFDLEVSRSMAEINRLSDEKQKALQEEAEAVRSRTTYSTLSNVAQYIAYVGMIGVGASMGGIPGAMLAASGIIGVGTRIAHDSRFLEAAVQWYTKSEQLQVQLTRDIQIASFLLQLGLAFGSGMAAWQAGGLANSVGGSAILETVKTAVAGAGTAMSLGGQVGARYYDKKIAHFQAAMKEQETRTMEQHQNLYDASTQMNQMIETGQSQAEEARKMIKAQETSQD